jgi:hypothetical protein
VCGELLISVENQQFAHTGKPGKGHQQVGDQSEQQTHRGGL